MYGRQRGETMCDSEGVDVLELLEGAVVVVKEFESHECAYLRKYALDLARFGKSSLTLCPGA